MKTSDTNSEITDLESPSQENPETGDGGGDLCSVRILARLHIIFLVTMIGIMLLVIGIGMLALKNLETDDMMDTYDEALSMDDDVEFDIRPGYDYQTIAPSSSPTPNPSTDLSNESFLGYDSQTVAPSSSPTPNPSTDLSNEPSLGYDYQIVAPSSSPTPNPSTDLSNEPFLLQLEDIFGTEITGKLNDPESPQALAYDWILHQDELSFTRSSTNPTNVQRFILASFYFATGGRRTTASWSMCSAVPVTTDQDFSTPMRCVFEQNISVCAPHEHFLECPEYYQHMESPPRNPKKRWLSKSSECNWYGILCNEDGNVYQILLQDNGLAGVLISELNALEELTIIHLDDNNLEGALPKFDNLDLQHLSLYGNQLEGTLELADEWMDLRTLVLGGGNQLNVTLTPIFGLTEKLEFLDLGGNIVGSTLPITFGYSWSQLVQMKLGNTQLSGPLPKGLVGLTSLITLELENNELTGTLPAILWDLDQLKSLRLENNQFAGSLSTYIGNLVNLRVLSIAETGLSGTLPSELSNLQYLELATFQHNGFSGTVPEALCDQMPRLQALEADCLRSDLDCACCTLCCPVGKPGPKECEAQ